MATENKVLTPAEVLALPEGARVWVEEHPRSYLGSTVYTRQGDHLKADPGCFYDLTDPDWYIFGERVDVRVWSLPQPPTQEEMGANPWEEVQHGA